MRPIREAKTVVEPLRSPWLDAAGLGMTERWREARCARWATNRQSAQADVQPPTR